MEPWIKLYRKFREWEWYNDPVVKAVFIELLLTANWKPTKWKGIDLDVGETIIGRKELAEAVGVSEQNVRTALKKLEKANTIVKKSTNKYTVVKVLNYCNYQGFDNESQPTTNQQLTNNQPTTNQQLTTPKEYKNLRNIDIYNYYYYYNSDFKTIVNAYENNIGVVAPMVFETLKSFYDDLGAELTVYAIEEAVRANARNIRYIEGIVRSWKEKGITSVEGAMLATAEHRTKSTAKSKSGAGPIVTNKKNFFQDYDDELSEFEIELMRNRTSGGRDD